MVGRCGEGGEGEEGCIDCGVKEERSRMQRWMVVREEASPILAVGVAGLVSDWQHGHRGSSESFREHRR